MSTITLLQVLDSRGNPTIQAINTAIKPFIKITVPSGASTGSHEALELRDGGKPYGGKAVTKAIAHAIKASEQLNWEQANYTEADKLLREIDGTPNKKVLGANSILALSMLQTCTQAHQEGKELFAFLAEQTKQEPRLPLPFANVINGGKHAGNNLQLQEFMIVPIQAKTFSEATKIVAETYQALKQLIAEQYGQEQTGLGDEGGFAPNINTAKEACDLLLQAAKTAGHKVGIAIDAAATEFYKEGSYQISNTTSLGSEDLIQYYTDLIKHYPIISLEDPFQEDDYHSFAQLRHRLQEQNLVCQVVGDDLTVSNPERILAGIEHNACDCLLLKINQIGTITEALEAATFAQEAGWNIMVSHRSGETSDTFISDLATGLGTGQIKLGAPARGERTAKYNRLLELETLYNLPLKNTFKK